MIRVIGLSATLAIAMAAAPMLSQAQQMYAYPARGQSDKQQGVDHRACHTWAVNHSGFDPGYSAPAPAPRTGGALRGAAGGAAIGAIGGAIGGNAGRGAAIGAATGGLIGAVRQNRQNRDAAAQQQARVDSFNRALATCLRGRGYTVD